MEVMVTKEKLLDIENMLEGIRWRIEIIARRTVRDKMPSQEVFNRRDWMGGIIKRVDDIEKELNLPISDRWKREAIRRKKEGYVEYCKDILLE